MSRDSNVESDLALLAAIITEAKGCGASELVSLFESRSQEILAQMAEARRLGDEARRRSSPFVYVMQ